MWTRLIYWIRYRNRFFCYCPFVCISICVRTLFSISFFVSISSFVGDSFTIFYFVRQFAFLVQICVDCRLLQRYRCGAKKDSLPLICFWIYRLLRFVFVSFGFVSRFSSFLHRLHFHIFTDNLYYSFPSSFFCVNELNRPHLPWTDCFNTKQVHGVWDDKKCQLNWIIFTFKWVQIIVQKRPKWRMGKSRKCQKIKGLFVEVQMDNRIL